MIDKFIFNELNKEIDFEPDYTVIKDSISIEKYIQSRKNINIGIRIRLFSLFATAILILCSIIIPLSLNSRITYIDTDKIIYESDKDFIDANEFVFIAKVAKKIRTAQYDGTGTDIPYTFYSLDVEEFLKGNGERNETLCFYGGKNTLGTQLIAINDCMPQTGEYYLFIVNRKKENSTNNRIGEKDFILADNDNKILLKNYKSGVSISEQEEETRLTIQRYKNIIDKDTGIISSSLEFENDKELVDYFDYIFIAKMENQVKSDGGGAGSEVVSAFYRVSVLHFLKVDKQQYNGRICFYGVDYWGTGGVSLPGKGGIYLIFANKKPDDCTNGRMDNDDYIIYENTQMVLLENYNPEEGYLKQNEEIIKILNRYVNSLGNTRAPCTTRISAFWVNWFLIG